MSAVTALPGQGLHRFEEWHRQAARDPDLFRFADPSLDICFAGTARHPGAEDDVPGAGGRARVFHVSRLRKRAERTGAAPYV